VLVEYGLAQISPISDRKAKGRGARSPFDDFLSPAWFSPD
jgi:hypothetical protein